MRAWDVLVSWCSPVAPDWSSISDLVPSRSFGDTDFRTLDAIVISHMHLDHALDLLALRHSLAYNPIPAPALIPVWLPPGGIDLLSRAAAPFDACDEPGRFAATVQNAEFEPGQPVHVGDVVITFTPAVDYIPAWAIRIHAPGAADLGYTGDTGPAATLSEFFAGVGVLVAESTLLEPGARPATERGSLTAAEAGQLAADVGAETLVLTHMWEEFGFSVYRAQAAEHFSGRIEMANPGLTITW